MVQGTIFRKVVAVLVIISQISCTTLHPIEASPETLQERIRQGDIVKVGDSVSIFTADEKEHRFVVTAIDADEIRGEGSPPASYDSRRGPVPSMRTTVAIPIDSIVAVKSREFSIGKTALLTGGITDIMMLIAIAIGPALVLGASGP